MDGPSPPPPARGLSSAGVPSMPLPSSVQRRRPLDVSPAHRHFSQKKKRKRERGPGQKETPNTKAQEDLFAKCPETRAHETLSSDQGGNGQEEYAVRRLIVGLGNPGTQYEGN